MSYTLSLSQNNIVIDTTVNTHELSTTTVKNEISLSRTGGQGAKGDSITAAYLNNDAELIIEISNSAGVIVETINAGGISEYINLNLDDLRDVVINLTGAGYYLGYNTNTNKWVSKLIPLNDLSDVTITNPTNLEVISFDVATNRFKNHKLTTASITNIDETTRADGSLLVYSSSSSKYKATSVLDNPNTTIQGGSF